MEILNLLGRDNLRYDLTRRVNAATRWVGMSRDTLVPILSTAGFVVDL